MSNHPFGPGRSQKSAPLPPPLPLPGHTAATSGNPTFSSTSSSSLTGAPWVQRAGRLQPLPATHRARQPLTGRDVLHVGAPRSTGSSSSSSSSSLSLAPQDESAWADMPPLEPQDPAPARTERKSEERPAPVQRRAAARVKRETVNSEPLPVPLSSTSAGTRAPKRKAEGASIEGSQGPSPGRKAEGRPLPSSSRLAQAGEMPVSSASSSVGASWQERLGALLDEGTGEDDAVSLPSDPAAWSQALAQVLPELARALELTRPTSVDAALTEAEGLAVDLAHHLGELLAQLPSPLAAARAQSLRAQAQDALQRLGRAAALPNGALADGPALQRAAGTGEGEEALEHQAEVLALRLGGMGMRSERRDLVLAHWVAAALAGGSPQLLCLRVETFARVASRLAAQPQATQWLADALHAAARQVLMQASSPDAVTASSDALGKAFAPLLARDAEAVVNAMAPLFDAPVRLAWPVDTCIYPLVRAIAETAGNSRPLEIALLQHGIALFTAADDPHVAAARWFAGSSMALVAGTSETAGEASADLLHRVSDACRAQDRRLPPAAAALSLAGMIFDSDPQDAAARKVLVGLARLPLARAAELLGMLCAHQLQAASHLRAVLCDERFQLPGAQAAHVALAFGLAQRAAGTAAVQALFPAAAQVGPRYALCRAACLAALRPIEVLRLPLPNGVNNLALLREALRLAPSGGADFSTCARISVAGGDEQRARRLRLAAHAELFEAGDARSARDHLLPAHRLVLVDLQCLLAPSAPAPTRAAALQYARRFYGTLERCHASVGLGAVVPSAAAREQARAALDRLEEMLLDLRRQDAELQAVAVPLVQREADRVRALLAQPA